MASKNSCTTLYTRIFLAIRNYSINLILRLPVVRYNGALERFYMVLKDVCTTLYTRIFLAIRNHSTNLILRLPAVRYNGALERFYMVLN